jgi:hypothetical protein
MSYFMSKLSIILSPHEISHADHSGRTVYSMNLLRPFEHWGRGFESHSRHVCVHLFCVYVVLCVDRGLATG